VYARENHCKVRTSCCDAFHLVDAKPSDEYIDCSVGISISGTGISTVRNVEQLA
jgi:hypothetical protein